MSGMKEKGSAINPMDLLQFPESPVEARRSRFLSGGWGELVEEISDRSMLEVLRKKGDFTSHVVDAQLSQIPGTGKLRYSRNLTVVPFLVGEDSFISRSEAKAVAEEHGKLIKEMMSTAGEYVLTEKKLGYVSRRDYPADRGWHATERVRRIALEKKLNRIQRRLEQIEGDKSLQDIVVPVEVVRNVEGSLEKMMGEGNFDVSVGQLELLYKTELRKHEQEAGRWKPENKGVDAKNLNTKKKGGLVFGGGVVDVKSNNPKFSEQTQVKQSEYGKASPIFIGATAVTVSSLVLTGCQVDVQKVDQYIDRFIDWAQGEDVSSEGNSGGVPVATEVSSEFVIENVEFVLPVPDAPEAVVTPTPEGGENQVAELLIYDPSFIEGRPLIKSEEKQLIQGGFVDLDPDSEYVTEQTNMLELAQRIGEIAADRGLQGEILMAEYKDQNGRIIGLLPIVTNVKENGTVEYFAAMGVNELGEVVPVGQSEGMFFWNMEFGIEQYQTEEGLKSVVVFGLEDREIAVNGLEEKTWIPFLEFHTDGTALLLSPFGPGAVELSSEQFEGLKNAAPSTEGGFLSVLLQKIEEARKDESRRDELFAEIDSEHKGWDYPPGYNVAYKYEKRGSYEGIEDFKINIGLEDSLVNADEGAITKIEMNSKGADAITYYFLAMSFNQWRLQGNGDESTTFEQYLELVKNGEGKYVFFAQNKAGDSFTYSDKVVDPSKGVTFFFTNLGEDEELPVKYDEHQAEGQLAYFVDPTGRLVIVSSYFTDWFEELEDREETEEYITNSMFKGLSFEEYRSNMSTQSAIKAALFPVGFLDEKCARTHDPLNECGFFESETTRRLDSEYLKEFAMMTSFEKKFDNEEFDYYFAPTDGIMGAFLIEWK